MNDRVLSLANAILYEGYLLYPYRSTALKNCQRWHFGVLYPRSFCEREQANDAWTMQTECLVSNATDDASVQITLRFLQMLPDSALAREVCVETGRLEAGAPRTHLFEFDEVKGSIEISASALERGAWRLRVRILNLSSFQEGNRDEALCASMVSMHAVLEVDSAQFISAIDPPAEFREIAAQCANTGMWPVLVGDEGASNTLLSAPIILSDYPKIAPRSAGDYFDCTEIDEMLALRILTLTEDEKQAMRRDERTRGLLERTEAFGAHQFANLHASVQPYGPGARIGPGRRVRLRPKGRADIFDLALDGKIGIVESVECDFEDRVYVTVTVEDDPGRDLGRAGQPGHRFFFRTDEVEPV